MNFTTLSTEQLSLYSHEIEGILCLLEDIVPARLGDADRKQYETLLEQAYVLGNQITFETGRRQLLHLQAQLKTQALVSKNGS
jgi:hypothetical protein